MKWFERIMHWVAQAFGAAVAVLLPAVAYAFGIEPREVRIWQQSRSFELLMIVLIAVVVFLVVSLMMMAARRVSFLQAMGSAAKDALVGVLVGALAIGLMLGIMGVYSITVTPYVQALTQNLGA